MKKRRDADELAACIAAAANQAPVVMTVPIAAPPMPETTLKPIAQEYAGPSNQPWIVARQGSESIIQFRRVCATSRCASARQVQALN
jgi:hypothetical protein